MLAGGLLEHESRAILPPNEVGAIGRFREM
jgi:hypothetical protein